MCGKLFELDDQNPDANALRHESSNRLATVTVDLNPEDTITKTS